MEHSFEGDSEVNVGMITFVTLVKTVAKLNGVSTCEWNRDVRYVVSFSGCCFLLVGSNLFCVLSIKSLDSLSSNRLGYPFRIKVVVSVLSSS